MTEEGMEIVDVEFRRESRGMVLRLFLDRSGGVNLDDLARVSRQLGDLLDVHNTVPGAYTLELSSPGINRRLRRPDHFGRYIGRRVRVRAVVGVEGRRSFFGKLENVEPDGVRIADPAGTYFIRFSDIAQANYEPES
ncbi:MAG: ribosome maturation factor RimP [Deltaproteobacteria bacterium]|nr:ribosome maturation factor RimP [Deltaproteobacteria bacterium]